MPPRPACPRRGTSGRTSWSPPPGCLPAPDSRDAPAQARLSEFQPTVAALSLLQTRLTAWVGEADIEALAAGSPLAQDHLHFLRQSTVRARHLMNPYEEALAADLVLSGSTSWERLHANLTSQLTVTVQLDGQESRLPMAAGAHLAQPPR